MHFISWSNLKILRNLETPVGIMGEWLHLEDDVVFPALRNVCTEFESPIFQIGVRRFHVRICPAHRPKLSDATFLAVHLRMEEVDPGTPSFKGEVMIRVPIRGALYYTYRTKEETWSNQNRSNGTYRFILSSTLFDENRTLLVDGNLHVMISVRFSEEVFPGVNTYRVEGGKQILYAPRNGKWEVLGQPKKSRPLSSVILSEDTKTTLVKDVRDFVASEEWYVDRGIPYRRRYILHGPPGCGKTSFITGIAAEIGYDVCIISLTAKVLNDMGLNVLLNEIPDNCIILLEDVDMVARSPDDTGSPLGSSGLSSGGLLHALFGVASPQGQMVFMTATCVENLHPALVDKGRSVQVHVGYPNDDQLSRIFANFYEGTTDETKRQFVAKIRELGRDVSLAAIEGLFILHKHKGKDVIDNVPKYFKE